MKKMENVVHAVSFPKSGRTWIELMIAKIYSDLTGSSILKILNGEPTGFNEPLFINLKPKELKGKSFANKLNICLPRVKFSHGYRNPEICKGNYFPSEFYKNTRVFLLVRDPRDVVVSHYFHMKFRSQLFRESLSDFIKFPVGLKGQNSPMRRFGITPIINYMNAWINHSNLFKELYVGFYEDFHKDVEFQFKALLKFIGIEVEKELLEIAIRLGEFKNMQKMERNGALNWHGLIKGRDPSGNKVRKGLVGGYIGELNEKDLEFINLEIEKLHPHFNRYKNFN